MKAPASLQKKTESFLYLISVLCRKCIQTCEGLSILMNIIENPAGNEIFCLHGQFALENS